MTITSIPIDGKISTYPVTQLSTLNILQDHLSSLVDYNDALQFMCNRVEAIAKNDTASCLWFLQHPSLYTAGTSTQSSDILNSLPFPLHSTGRGGHITYHGPGQLVIYVMLNLKKWKCDIGWYIRQLEEWIIQSLKIWNIPGYRKIGYPGVWVKDCKSNQENKIAAIGVRIQRWVTFHGVSINVNPCLDHSQYIIPCGIKNHGVTSLEKQGCTVLIENVAWTLKQRFTEIFM